MSTRAKFAYAIPIIAAVALPYLALVASATSQPVNYSVWKPTILKGPLVTCWGPPVTFDKDANPTDNPYACTSLCDLVSTTSNVIYFGIGVVIWIITPIFFAWAGVKLMLSRGDPTGTSEAKKMMWGVVMGLLITLCAYIIVFTFVSVLKISGIGGFNNPTCVIQQ